MGGVPGASGIFRGTHVREQERTLNPTGVLVIAAVVLFAIGIAIESSEEGGTVHYAAAFPPA